MEDLNEQLHPDYLKRFNDGYLIAKHVPDLAEKLRLVKGNSIQMEGFQDGIKQYDLEKIKDTYPKWLEKDRLSSLDKEAPKEKDKEGPGKD